MCPVLFVVSKILNSMCTRTWKIFRSVLWDIFLPIRREKQNKNECAAMRPAISPRSRYFSRRSTRRDATSRVAPIKASIDSRKRTNGTGGILYRYEQPSCQLYAGRRTRTHTPTCRLVYLKHCRRVCSRLDVQWAGNDVPASSRAAVSISWYAVAEGLLVRVNVTAAAGGGGFRHTEEFKDISKRHAFGFGVEI